MKTTILCVALLVPLGLCWGGPQVAQATAPGSVIALGPITEQNVDEMPTVVTKKDPAYPELARKAGKEGTVFVRLIVTIEGKVSDAVVMKSEDEIFNEAALRAAKEWTFKPAQKGGKPVQAELVIPFRFKLAKEDSAPAQMLLDGISGILEGQTPRGVSVAPDAYIIDERGYTSLPDAVKSKKSLFAARKQPRKIGFSRIIMDDARTTAFIVLKFENSPGVGTSWHTVGATKNDSGQWEIRHWHISK